jgi:hypothetical protein
MGESKPPPTRPVPITTIFFTLILLGLVDLSNRNARRLLGSPSKRSAPGMSPTTVPAISVNPRKPF